MAEETIRPDQSRWRVLYYAAIVAVLILAPVAISKRDTCLFVNIFFITPTLVIISLVCVIWLVRAGVRDRQRYSLPVVTTLVVIWAISISLFFYQRNHPFELRETVRWMVHSREYKSAVLARPTLDKTELRHIEWDASGFAGIANDTVFLVFDPQDALSMGVQSRAPIKLSGVPCEVRSIRRMESHWYAVLFYTDEYWGKGNCN
jgi:hypothetical protein